MRGHLQTSLNSFTELIQLWQHQNLAAINMLVSSSQGKTLLKQVLLEQGDNPVTHEALGDWLYPVLTVMGFDGFSVINHERVLSRPAPNRIASSRCYYQKPWKCWIRLANVEISRPVVAMRPLDGPRGLNQPVR